MHCHSERSEGSSWSSAPAHSIRSLGALVALFAAPFLSAAEEPAPAALEFFEKQVRPILANRCYECHGDKKQKGDLRLDHLDHMLRGGASGPALAPGKPADSLLIKAVHRKDEDLQMPPDDPLPPAEIAVLEKWIQIGAPWPATDAHAAHVGAARDEHGLIFERKKHWSFQPLTRPTAPTLAASDPPTTAARAWARTAIDRFVAAKHLELGLTPAPAAGAEELIRRLTFDVHGLPPAQAQIEAFTNAHARDPKSAITQLVDSLLASPRYGERWAQHWLDLVRYAESDGYRADEFRKSAWPYRDYVIRSLNADKPYDQFVREQLAGDELAPDNPDILIATSYLRTPIYEWNQRDVRGQHEIIVTDLTDNAGEVFLGLSMGCARCHDHKFDPILQKDYYALRAFFEPVIWRTDLELATAAEQKAYAEQLAKWEAATAELRARRDALLAPELNKNVKRAYDRFTEDIRAMIDKPVAQRTAQEHILASIAYRQMEYEHERFDPLKALKKPEDKERLKEIETALKAFDHLKPKPLLDAFVATDAHAVPPPTVMKSRRGEQAVTPAFLTLLEKDPPTIAPLPSSTGRRTALAAWITRADNPLSTRTIVNRIWQYHFGRGLAGTPNDLGHLGERPTHPELLDFLVQRFLSQGWSLKKLHREILLSATYQQTARIALPEKAALVDPTNKFYWRYSPRRLDAEQARDAILAATGELDLAAGGPSVDANTTPRRSIYTIKKRNNPNELLRALDAPPGFSSIADRQQTSTPLQALLFLNGDWMLQRSRRLGATAQSPEQLWHATLGRRPAVREQQLAADFLTKRLASEKPAADSRVAQPLDLEAGYFAENTPQERLIARNAPREGDDFTLEAVFTLGSIDAGAAVRTIASRWNGEKSSLEAHGWSVGITGAKSGYKPRHLILQLVGEDDNMNTTYEVVPSGLFLELHRPYRIAVRVSTTDHTATFTVRDLSTNAAPQTATAKHNVVGKLGIGQSVPVVGGLSKRSPSQFHGQITAVRLVHGLLPDDALAQDPAKWPADGLVWSSSANSSASFIASGNAGSSEPRDPKTRALADLAHVLLNSNEFLYLH